MSRSLLLLLTAFLSACRYGANAAIAMTHTIDCQTLDIDGTSQEVCVTYFSSTPSPAQLENGTTIYLGPYSFIYAFWQGLEEGTDVTTLENPAFFANMDLSVNVTWTDDEECSVDIVGQECASCSICDASDDPYAVTLSADCTNVNQGRVVDCQPAFIFYPVNAAGEVSTATPVVVDGDGDGDDETDNEIDGDEQEDAASGSTSLESAATRVISMATFLFASILL